MHTSIYQRRGHDADFRVKYRFRKPEEGGRNNIPYQGYHSDFSIDGEENNRLYMVWPEFEDKFGNVITDDSVPVPISGTAKMWIVRENMRPHHYGKINVGVIGYFREGRRKVADCEVIEILGLLTNPIN